MVLETEARCLSVPESGEIELCPRYGDPPWDDVLLFTSAKPRGPHDMRRCLLLMRMRPGQ